MHYPLVQRLYGAHTTMVATRWVDVTNEDLQRTEWEANWFAAAFLMPEVEFQKVSSSKGALPSSIANQFGLTEKAVTVRAKSLGITLSS